MELRISRRSNRRKKRRNEVAIGNVDVYVLVRYPAEIRPRLRWSVGLRRKSSSSLRCCERCKICWTAGRVLRQRLHRLFRMCGNRTSWENREADSRNVSHRDISYRYKWEKQVDGISGDVLPQLKGRPFHDPSEQTICHVVRSLLSPEMHWKVTWEPWGNLLQTQ